MSAEQIACTPEVRGRVLRDGKIIKINRRSEVKGYGIRCMTGRRSENKYPPNERGNWRTRLRVLESQYFPIGTSEVERYLCPSLNSKGRAIFCPRRHPFLSLFRLRSTAVGRRAFVGKINIISSMNSFNAVFSQVIIQRTDSRGTNSLYPYRHIIFSRRDFNQRDGAMASQLTVISCTSKRPISERLHQLERSKDENVSRSLPFGHPLGSIRRILAL